MKRHPAMSSTELVTPAAHLHFAAGGSQKLSRTKGPYDPLTAAVARAAIERRSLN